MMKRKDYTKEFKVEALRLASVGDKPQTQVARELGIRVNQLRKWRLQLEKQVGAGPEGAGAPQPSDIARLRRENAELKEEVEILKKAAIFFARESR
jgi:transposase